MVLRRLKKMRIHHHGLWIFAIMLVAAIILPSPGEDPTIRTILSLVGTLFGLITGFALTHLWTRFREMRTYVARETSGLMNYFNLARILGESPKHRVWFAKQADLIDHYLVAWIPVEWHEYHKADYAWQAVSASVDELQGKIEKGMQGQIFSRLLQSTMSINEAREDLNILGKNRLSREMWGVITSLAAIFLFTLFYLKTMTPASILFTSFLATAVIILLLATRELDMLRFGEEAVSFEPYERVLDVIGKPRFYPKELVEAGRIKLHAGKLHRVV